jgi:ketosteroid isomerase-like protein
MNKLPNAEFNFAAFKRAFVSKDISRCLDFFAENAEWIEYKHPHPPKTIRLMKGKREIAGFLAEMKASNVTLSVEDEVVSPSRAAFCVLCTFSDGKKVVENVVIHISDGKITEEIDVETSDNCQVA